MKLNSVYATKDYNALITITDSEDVVIDITGYTLTFVARKDSQATNSIVSSLSLTDPTNGKAKIGLSPTDTDVELGKYSFQLLGTDDLGEALVFGTGTFVLLEAYA